MWGGNTAILPMHSRKLKLGHPAFQKRSFSVRRQSVISLFPFCIINFYNKLLKQEAASQYQEWTCSVFRQWSARTLKLQDKKFAFAKSCDGFCVLSTTEQVLVLSLVQQQTILMQALLRSLQPNCSVTDVHCKQTQQVTKERYSLLQKWRHLKKTCSFLSPSPKGDLQIMCNIWAWIPKVIAFPPSKNLSIRQAPICAATLHQTFLIVNNPNVEINKINSP